MVVFMRLSLENQNNSHSRFFLKRLITVVIVGLAADMLSYAVDTQVFFGAKLLNHASVLVCTLVTTLAGYLWNRFFDVVFPLPDRESSQRILSFLPFAAMAVLLGVNLFCGIFYSIDAENVYSRGPLMILSFVLEYVSFAVLAVRAACRKFPVRTLRYKKLRRGRGFRGQSLALFPLRSFDFRWHGVGLLLCPRVRGRSL